MKTWHSSLILPIVAVLLGACGQKVEPNRATLYRNSPIAPDLRVHWASFDADESDPNYNINNCMMAARVLNANLIANAKAEGKEPYTSVGFWCEAGGYNPEGSIPVVFSSDFPTDV